MYLTIKIEEELTKEQSKELKQKIKDVVSNEGYNYQLFDYIHEAFIDCEIEYRNANIGDFGFERHLTESELSDLANTLYGYDELFTSLTETIDSEIGKIMEE